MSNTRSRLCELNRQIAATRRALEELFVRRQRILNERDGRLQEAAQAADPTADDDGFDRILREVSPKEHAAMEDINGETAQTVPES